jgi:hypothetical protein
MFKGNNFGSWFSLALGIGAASFWSEAEKDKAESPTAKPERPKQLTIGSCLNLLNIVWKRILKL